MRQEAINEVWDLLDRQGLFTVGSSRSPRVSRGSHRSPSDGGTDGRLAWLRDLLDDAAEGSTLPADVDHAALDELLFALVLEFYRLKEVT